MQLFKIDIKSAYRCIPVRPADYHLLGLIHENQAIFDAVLPFGLRSSCAIFETFSTAANWIIENHIPALRSKLLHYIDDFLGLCIGQQGEAAATLKRVLFIMRHLGIPIAPEKIEGPARLIVFLGILINLDAQTVSLDEKKLESIKKLISEWLLKTHCSYSDIESLAGTLYWSTRVIRGGRTFLRRVIEAKRNRPHRGLLPVEPDIREDLQWWSRFLLAFNGKSILPESDWTSSTASSTSEPRWALSTDACRTGFGARWNNYYLHGQWSPSQLAATQRKRGIAISTLELAAIIIAVKSWGTHWQGKRITIESDNEPSVITINTGTCKDTLMMKLTRELWYLCCVFDFEIRAVHVPGLQNVDADLLSRGCVQSFLKNHPSTTFSRTAALPPDSLP